MDFGLARLTEGQVEDSHASSRQHLTDPGVVMGTPAFMAPEQARGEQAAIGPAADIYSLGVLMYVLLTGRRPFEGSSYEMIYRLLHDEPRPPRELRADVPPYLEAICLKCLAKSPAGRPGSAEELANALRTFLDRPIPPVQGDFDADKTVYPEGP